MLATEIRTDPHSSPARRTEPLEAERSVTTVKVYTRHNRGCSKREQSDWARCNCMKWLYIYRDGKCKLASAKTRSWERAEQKAREVRDTSVQMQTQTLRRNSRRVTAVTVPPTYRLRPITTEDILEVIKRRPIVKNYPHCNL